MAAVMAVESENFKFVTVIISLCFCIFLPLSEKPVIQPEKGQLSSLLALQVCWQNSGVLDFTWQGSGGHMCGAWSAHACGALVQWSEEFSGSADVQPMPPCVQKNKSLARRNASETVTGPWRGSAAYMRREGTVLFPWMSSSTHSTPAF